MPGESTTIVVATPSAKQTKVLTLEFGGQYQDLNLRQNVLWPL